MNIPIWKIIKEVHRIGTEVEIVVRVIPTSHQLTRLPDSVNGHIKDRVRKAAKSLLNTQGVYCFSPDKIEIRMNSPVSMEAWYAICYDTRHDKLEDNNPFNLFI